MFLNNDTHTKIIKKNSCVKRKWTLLYLITNSFKTSGNH